MCLRPALFHPFIGLRFNLIVLFYMRWFLVWDSLLYVFIVALLKYNLQPIQKIMHQTRDQLFTYSYTQTHTHTRIAGAIIPAKIKILYLYAIIKLHRCAHRLLFLFHFFSRSTTSLFQFHSDPLKSCMCTFSALHFYSCSGLFSFTIFPIYLAGAVNVCVFVGRCYAVRYMCVCILWFH